MEHSPTLYSMAFFDVQNLFRHAKNAFQQTPGDGYHHPNFDPVKLHAKVAQILGLKPNLTRFYTGTPPASESEMWSGYWSNRVRSLKRSGVIVETRTLRYHRGTLPDGTIYKVPQEKGIDIRISLDLVACARRKEFDVAIIFSQDQDLSEATEEVKLIAKEQGRFIKIVSAYPASVGATSPRGINKTEWFKFDKSFYDSCIDPYDYRPAKFK
jgi:NYN domain